MQAYFCSRVRSSLNVHSDDSSDMNSLVRNRINLAPRSGNFNIKLIYLHWKLRQDPFPSTLSRATIASSRFHQPRANHSSRSAMLMSPMSRVLSSSVNLF